MENFKNIIKEKKIRIIMFLVLDVLSLTLCSFLAMALRFDFHNIPYKYTNIIYNYLIIDALVLIFIFWAYRIYKSMWSYASISELISIFFSCTTFILVEYIYKCLILKLPLPRSYYLIKLFLLYIFISAIRYSYRIAKTVKEYYRERSGLKNTMIVGAGDAGRLLITEIWNNKANFKNKICCVIDDDKNKIGSYIKNIPIVGNRKTIAQNVEKYHIEEIIIAIPSISNEKLNLIIDECQKTKCIIKTLPSLSELVGEPTMKEVRPISYEDLVKK